ncbi:LOW QUALITY PROTEIN: hypothetical protein N665_0432s0030 [Sinapis alba]|nr:LOW QUALITY PROTEIN: hypothetical protein N665_0432s0030 [Sinapis alba]
MVLKQAFWFDHWSPLRPLIKLLGPSGTRQLGTQQNAKVSSCCTDIGWNSRHVGSSQAEELQIMLCSNSLPSICRAFLMWVAYLDRLPTRVRITSWGMQIEKACCICNHLDENRDHLFLRCTFSEQIWKFVIYRFSYIRFLFYTSPAPFGWLQFKDNICLVTLKYIDVQAVIYSLWAERSSILLSNIISTLTSIFHVIDMLIRNLILTRKNHKKIRPLI